MFSSVSKAICTGFVSIVACSSIGFSYDGGDGTEGKPYQIAGIGDWRQLVDTPDDWDKHFVLTADIDLAGQIYTRAAIAPDTSTEYGFQGPAFGGVFDGQGHVIRNATLEDPDSLAWYVGLFGCIGAEGHIRNLAVQNLSVGGRNYCGGLCGWNRGTLSNCSVEGRVSRRFGEGDFGGLCGQNDGDIANCLADVNISAGYASRFLGGLCGRNTGLITNSGATGAVNSEGSGQNVGGLCGQNHGQIIACFATGDVTGEGGCYYYGGLCGQNPGLITDSFATGDVSAGQSSNYVGGLCGTNGGTTRRCYATGTVCASGDFGGTFGGLCGYNTSSGTINLCYATGAVSGGAFRYFGGLCGENRGRISASYAAGTVSTSAKEYGVGGFCGFNRTGTISACFAAGAINASTASSYVGGFCGDNWAAIQDCYATGAVNGGTYVGGFIGYNKGGVVHCYSPGRPTGTGSVGGLCGQTETGGLYEDIENYWDTETSQTLSSAMGAGRTTADMHSQATFAAWDLVDTWAMCGGSYPRLAWETPGDWACPAGVNVEDVVYLADRWLIACAEDTACGRADLNEDGTVDLADFAVLAIRWLQGL